MLLGAQGTSVEVDRLVEPLLMELPDGVSAMLSGVRSVRAGFEIVGGAFDGPMFVRSEGGGFAKKDAIGRLRQRASLDRSPEPGTFDVGSANGYRVVEHTRLGVESWSTVSVTDDVVALVPRESVDWFTRVLAVHAVGDPIALRGMNVHLSPDLVAMVWYVPGAADRDMRPLSWTTARLERRASDALQLTIVFAPERSEDAAAIATALEDIKRAAPRRLADAYRAATVQVANAAGRDRVSFEIAFAARDTAR